MQLWCLGFSSFWAQSLGSRAQGLCETHGSGMLMAGAPGPDQAKAVGRCNPDLTFPRQHVITGVIEYNGESNGRENGT